MSNSEVAKATSFLLDESLPYVVAQALQLVGYPITSCHHAGKDGCKDTELIPWMAEQRYVWITRDDAARNVHRALLTQARISMVWIRGTERPGGSTQRNSVTIKDVHRMLTNKLEEIATEVANARGPRYFLLFLSGNNPTLRKFPTIDEVSRQLSGARNNQSRST